MGGEQGVRVGASPAYLARFYRPPGTRPVFGLPGPEDDGPQHWRPRYSQAPYVWDTPQSGWVAARATAIGRRLLLLGFIAAFALFAQSVRRQGLGWVGWWRFLDELSITAPIRPDAAALWLGVAIGALFSAASRGRRIGVGLCALLVPVAYLAGDAQFSAAEGRWLFAATGTLAAAAWLLAKRRNPWSALAALLAAPLAIILWDAMRGPGFLHFILGSYPGLRDFVLLEGLPLWATAGAAIVAVWAGLLVDRVISR